MANYSPGMFRRHFLIESDSLHILVVDKVKNTSTDYYFSLKEVTVDELCKHRMKKKPGFVYKERDKLFLASIPKNLRLSVTNDIHLCSYSDKVCRFLSASSDPSIGCPKVRDRIVSESEYKNSPEKAMLTSKRIEKYDFITRGMETFNTVDDSLIVLECSHCQPISNTTPITSHHFLTGMHYDFFSNQNRVG